MGRCGAHYELSEQQRDAGIRRRCPVRAAAAPVTSPGRVATAAHAMARPYMATVRSFPTDKRTQLGPR